jgi:hypothetical protein
MKLLLVEVVELAGYKYLSSIQQVKTSVWLLAQ